jgi:hypothetical protein
LGTSSILRWSADPNEFHRLHDSPHVSFYDLEHDRSVIIQREDCKVSRYHRTLANFSFKNSPTRIAAG